MKTDKIWRWVRVVTLAAMTCLTIGSVAWGQDYGRYSDDDYYNRHDEAREQGYRNGYRDGLSKGQYDFERGRRFNFKNDDWEDSRGYEHWMGNKGHYKQAYREGYERAYRRAFGYDGREYRDDRQRDRDDWR